VCLVLIGFENTEDSSEIDERRLGVEVKHLS
jgi:hypothetical protein